MQHEINEQKDEAFNVQIAPNIESLGVTKLSANLMINALNDEAFNVQSIISPDIEVNKRFNILLGVLDAIELSTVTKILSNDVFRHRFISLDETSSIENMDKNTNDKNISNAIDFSDTVDFSNATDQIFDNSFNN